MMLTHLNDALADMARTHGMPSQLWIILIQNRNFRDLKWPI